MQTPPFLMQAVGVDSEWYYCNLAFRFQICCYLLFKTRARESPNCE